MSIIHLALINGVAALGVPAMGLAGAAWATTASRWQGYIGGI